MPHELTRIIASFWGRDLSLIEPSDLMNLDNSLQKHTTAVRKSFPAQVLQRGVRRVLSNSSES